MVDESGSALALGEAVADELDRSFRDAVSEIGGLVLQRVRDGKTSRRAAERWARLRGRPPFVAEPDPTGFDPMQCRYWSLGMMTAWAIWRARDAVRDEWPDYCAKWIVWHEVGPRQVRPISAARPQDTLAPRCGYEPRPREPNTPGGVITAARAWSSMKNGPGTFLEIERAKREILDALRQVPPVKDPALVALHGNRREPIAAEAWDALSPFGPGDTVFHLGCKIVPLAGLRVERDAVLKVWEPRPGDGVGTTPVTEAREAYPVEQAAVPGIVASATLAEDVGSTKRGSRPRITGDKLAVMMKHPPVADTINSNDFLSEARRRASERGRSVDQDEVRALYVTIYGKKIAGRPSGRKSRRVIP